MCDLDLDKITIYKFDYKVPTEKGWYVVFYRDYKKNMVHDAVRAWWDEDSHRFMSGNWMVVPNVIAWGKYPFVVHE